MIHNFSGFFVADLTSQIVSGLSEPIATAPLSENR